MRCCCLFLLCISPLVRGGVIDRIDIVVGRQVITELQVEEEIRVTAFLNDKPIANDEAQRRAAADRLIQQTLLRREMELSHYPAPTEDAVAQAIDQIRSQRGGASSFDRALDSYKLTEAILRNHLAFQIATLDFINLRFRSETAISAPDERRTDAALDNWLQEARRQVRIVYVDPSLKSTP